MDAVLHHSGPLQASLTVGPDKAICHRAVLLAALADGRTTIHPWPSADDCQRTLELVHRLGVPVDASQGDVVIDGRGPEGLSAPTRDLDCGESGTTLRLAAGVLAGQPFTSVLAAGDSLSQRPMRRIVEPLSRMGAGFGASPGRLQAPPARDVHPPELYPPLTIQGRRPLHAIRYEIPVASAQVKSAILLAGLFADGPTTVVERFATRDHTERMLRQFGLPIRCDGQAVTVEPGVPASPGTIRLPGDFSSAAFFLVAAACVPGSRLSVEDVSLNVSRTALVEVLRRMGARITTVAEEEEEWEPRGTMTVEGGSLRGIRLGPDEVPGLIDELPILMVAAACAQGMTRFESLGELRVKETDRVRSMLSGLAHLGASVRLVASETVEIIGGPLQGALVESAGDHRTAMSLAVAGLIASGTTTVRGSECVAKSFPDFFDRLGRLAGSSTVKTVDKA